MTRDPRVREHIEEIARMVIEDQIGILEATRALLPLLHGDPEMVPPDDYNLFRGIDSETDDLPLGRVRGEWNSDALLEKDRKILDASCCGVSKCAPHVNEFFGKHRARSNSRLDIHGRIAAKREVTQKQAKKWKGKDRPRLDRAGRHERLIA